MDNTTYVGSDEMHEDGYSAGRTVGVSQYYVSGWSRTAPSEHEAGITRIQLNATLREWEHTLRRFTTRTSVADFVWFRQEVEVLFSRMLGHDGTRRKP